eukprot:s1789_g10.t1
MPIASSVARAGQTCLQDVFEKQSCEFAANLSVSKVLQTQGGSGLGMRASLSTLSEGIAKTSVDAVFKAWMRPPVQSFQVDSLISTTWRRKKPRWPRERFECRVQL